jgi:hypothetical protein
MVMGLSVMMNGQQAPAPRGVPDDWSHHHLVFSNPGTFADALKNGTLAQWYQITNEPRYQIQQLKRDLLKRQLAAAPDFAARQALVNATNTAAATAAEAAAERPPKPPKVTVSKDWSMSLGSGGKLGAGQYPAKYSFSTTATPSCSDYVVFPTGIPGSGTQASIVAYNNLYATTCGTAATRPGIYWAYNTGGTASLSPVIVWNGDQVAFIQVSGTTASLVLLKMANSGGTVSNPSTAISSSVANNVYRSTAAPCYTTFSLGANDTYSAPYYDYAHDIMYVGDDSGKLHKFTGVFSGTPSAAGSLWPVSVSTNKLTSPVFDPGNSQDIFVADSGGFLYSYSTSGAPAANSSQLAQSPGIIDGPVVDSANELVYIFVGKDWNTSTTNNVGCKSGTSYCNGVFKFSISAFNSAGTSNTASQCVAASASSWSTGTNCGGEFTFGSAGGSSSSPKFYDGTFDNIYYSGTGTTGNIWACSPKTGTIPRLSYAPLASIPAAGATYNPSSSETAIDYLTGTLIPGTPATCSPVTEIYGTGGGTTDYIFLSVTNDGSQTGCSGSGSAGACLYNFVVSTDGRNIAVPTSATAGMAAAGGSSGIIIDNTSSTAGESQIYFSSLSNETCGGNQTTGSGTGGCAVQASQSALK